MAFWGYTLVVLCRFNVYEDFVGLVIGAFSEGRGWRSHFCVTRRGHFLLVRVQDWRCFLSGGRVYYCNVT